MTFLLDVNALLAGGRYQSSTDPLRRAGGSSSTPGNLTIHTAAPSSAWRERRASNGLPR